MPPYIVRSLVNCFIDGIAWADYISEVDRLSKITKEELVAFVNEHFADNYVRVDKIEKKIPPTPELQNRQLPRYYQQGHFQCILA